jgi:outer membrane protein assembly factor BamD (BamD/ComL family)
VKLAYKYPNDELIPTVMSRLGGYFQQKGQAFKEQADLLRDKEDEASKAEVLRLDELGLPEFLNAAMVFSKLQERFPDDPLAGLAGLRAGQNFMRAHQYEQALNQLQRVIDNEQYDGAEIRAQAIYWSGISHERNAGIMGEANYQGRGDAIRQAYELYRRVTFDFPDSIWAKYARGRLADPVFARIIEIETQERERMIEALKDKK